MYKVAFSKFHFGILLFVTLFFTACPPERDYLYEISEPVMMAFTHQINVDSLKNEITRDTLLEGYDLNAHMQLVGRSRSGFAYDLWLNDSLLIVKVKGFFVSRRQGINSKSGRILFELERRNNRAYLFENFPKTIAQSSFETKSFHPKYRNRTRRTNYISIPVETLTPANNLSWNGSLLNIEGQFYFEKGILQDTFRIRDSIRSLMIKGVFEKGLAIGQWQYFDLNGDLQWLETYQSGELIDVEKQVDAMKYREARLMTVKELGYLHRITFFVFLLLFGLVFWRYIKSFQTFTFPHRKMNKWSLIGGMLMSPFVASGTFIIYVFLSFFLFVFLQSFGWDLPYDIFSMIFVVLYFYFPFGILSFIATLRHQDLLWHAGLLTLGLFVFKSFSFLKKLDALGL